MALFFLGGLIAGTNYGDSPCALSHDVTRYKFFSRSVMKLYGSGPESSISIAMSPENSAPEFMRDASGLAHSGDIRVIVTEGPSPMFIWPDGIAYGLMVDTSLAGNERTMWEVHSVVGFSTSVRYGELPVFAEEIACPDSLIPGRRYFVSVYGTYPRYGIQEFIA